MKALAISVRLIVCHNQLGCQSGERRRSSNPCPSFFYKKRFDEIFALLFYSTLLHTKLFFCVKECILQSAMPPPRLLIIVKELYKSESESIIDNFLLRF